MSDQRDGCGCGALLGLLLVLALVVGAVISIASLVDPFSWMPPIGDVWADCHRDLDTSADECELANRYPGFWVHALVNLAYVVVGLVLLGWLSATVVHLRRARADRFSGPHAVECYRAARQALAALAALVAVLAAVPIVVALA